MIRRLLVLLGAALTLTASTGRSAVDSAAWESRQTFELGVTGPVRITLPPEIRAAARHDAADLRLLDPAGKEVAFALLNAIDDAPAPPGRIAVAPTSRLDGDTTVLEFTLPAATDVAAVHLASPARQFLKAVNVRWPDARGTVETEAIVFRQRDGEQELIVRSPATQATRGQIFIDNRRSAPVPITVEAVQPGPGADSGWSPRGVSAAELRVRTEHSAGRTRLLLNVGRRHQRVAFIALDRTDAVFHRRVSVLQRSFANEAVVEREIASGWIRRAVIDPALPELRYGGTGGLPVNFIAPSEEIEVSIEDGDSPPLAWDVRVELAPEFVAFSAATPGRYTLLAGNAGARTPAYDVNAFRAQWLQTPRTEVQPAPLSRNPAFRAAATPLDVPELAGAFSPEGWTQRRTVTVREPGAQVLELDLEVLARARFTLADLRLVRENRQVPYLLERPRRERAAPVDFVPAPDPQRPSVGRWKLSLPVPGAPYRSVRLTTDEALFERRVSLLELLPESHGNRAHRNYGTWIWTRRHSEQPGSITLPLDSVPRTRELVLEIDHGDNTPFAPHRIELTYPVVRLRFRASQPGDLALYFGHPTANTPSYDLQLVAPRLLDAPEIRAEFILDVEGRPVDGDAVGGHVPVSKVIFWGALVFVVTVLLVVVAKLLPKPPEPGTRR